MENGAFAPKEHTLIFHNIFKYVVFQRHQKALLWSKGLSMPYLQDASLEWVTNIFQVVDDFVKRVNGTEIAIISQEIFQHDPYTRVENLKVTKHAVMRESRVRDWGLRTHPLKKHKAVCFLRSTSMCGFRGG